LQKRPRVDEQEKSLRRLQRVAGKLTEADRKAAAFRQELYDEMVSARKAGVTISAMARALGVSRQRVQQIFERVDR
jgi:hypothetical protein